MVTAKEESVSVSMEIQKWQQEKNEFWSLRGEMQSDFVARILSSKVIAATGSQQEAELSPEGPFTLNMFSSACTQSLVTNQQKACWCFSFQCHIPHFQRNIKTFTLLQ